MRFISIILVTMLPVAALAGSETCAEGPFCKHSTSHQEQPDQMYPVYVNSQVTDLKEASADLQGVPEIDAFVAEQITD
ncbi:hypothetical protein [uncultured Pelagimonas sp.]|uniref:hypothetical protein n=1 Tax=uncultured Pelagimonas sp. TaxID=1618102 RepID=UPI00262F6B51|nr:hypothetical protein [uncultured Pelagimonas sp.]